MNRLLFSSALMLASTAIVVLLLRRPKSDNPVTWAGAMLGAVSIFGIFIVSYGVVPHEWLTYADSTLKWRQDRIILDSVNLFGKTLDSPIDVSARTLRDIVTTMIYGGIVTANLMLWSLWQKRPKRSDVPAPTPKPTQQPAGVSAFGRPVAKNG